MKRMIKTLIICAALSSVFYTVQASQARQNKEPVARGEKLFINYCASCHGLDGSGEGPVASSLKQRPNDLRRIQSRYGVFPAEEVGRKISGDLSATVHGRKDMPVWGLVLSASDINQLVKYLRTIQRVYPPQPAE
jgi:mono/diheme cytochrome c family protein